MKDVLKVPASAGAEWLLGGFRLLRQAPFGLASLGAIYGVIALLVPLSMQVNTTLFLILELLLVMLGPVLTAGMIYAAQCVDRGGRALPVHLLQGLREGKAPRLLATLIPQLLAVLVGALLLVMLIGGESLAQMAQAVQAMQNQAHPDPALVSGLPVGRLLLWMLLALCIGVVTSFFTFMAVPEIMLTDSHAWDAMQRSFRACMRNLPALIVFLVLAVIAVFAIYVAVILVAAVLRLLVGEWVMQLVTQLLATAVLMPVLTGAMYLAWKQMFSGGGAIAAPTMGGFEA
ncbi:BPSS1780 family membrane protein [Cognatiluteimonas profundi]|uniref:BPSS1780 family membrane protein n=1 Tax=Cognatiluteimonas profundi TaxID=2594501 RepID=UPI00131CDBE9|nr:BPSS1780 family membrane protein [Lysobacter profundi]